MMNVRQRASLAKYQWAIQSDWLCGYKPRRSVEGKMVCFDVYEK